MIEPYTRQQKPYKILLIGDECTDEYQYGIVDRISPEAPVPVFKPTYKEIRPGMAGNVQQNLENLGLLVQARLGDAGTKTRLIDSRSKQHIARIDQDIPVRPVDLYRINWKEFDAVVVSDYDKGAVTYELVEKIIMEFSGPVFVDSKKHDLCRFNGAIVKINEHEYRAGVSTNDNLIVTLGSQGAMWQNRDHQHHFNAKSVDVADVCGAGDTFLSALVYQYLIKKKIPEAIEFAIRASAVTVQHIGVYAPTLEEIK